MIYQDNSNNTSRELGILLLRLFIGGILLFHGYSKLHDISFVKIQLENNHFPTVLAYGTYIAEIIAPLLIIIGYRTRFFSMIIAINCLVAIFLVHRAELFVIDPTTGGWAIETLGLFLGGAISLICTGGGKYTLSQRSSGD